MSQRQLDVQRAETRERHRAAGTGDPEQGAGRHTGAAETWSGYPMGQARRVTRANNRTEDRLNNDPHVRGGRRW